MLIITSIINVYGSTTCFFTSREGNFDLKFLLPLLTVISSSISCRALGWKELFSGGKKKQTRQPNHLFSLLPAETLSTLFVLPHSLLQAAATYCCLTTINSATGSCSGFHASILWPSRFCLLCLLCTILLLARKKAQQQKQPIQQSFPGDLLVLRSQTTLLSVAL